MTHLFNIMFGIGIFGGIVLGVWMVPYAFALILHDDVWIEANRPAFIAWLICVAIGVIGLFGLRTVLPS